jgi:ubiquinol-cytochrome c reductase iron-sulfur subunit
MSETTVDTSKRTWLITSGCVGAVGGVAVAVPFVSSFSPSERAKAAGAAVEVDIGAIKPGEKLTVEWRGKPVWIIRRTPEQLEALKKVESQLADPESQRKPTELTPEYARNQVRSIKPEFFVGVGICSPEMQIGAFWEKSRCAPNGGRSSSTLGSAPRLGQTL